MSRQPRRRGRRGALTGFATSLAPAIAACSQPPPPAPPSPLLIAVDYLPPSSCRLRVSGRSYVVPGEENSLAPALREAAAHSPQAMIVSDDPNLPYRCFGYAIYMGQRAGFERVGFVSEPATADEPRP